MFSALNNDVDFLSIMCFHLHRLFLDDSADLRDASMNVFTTWLSFVPYVTDLEGNVDSQAHHSGGYSGVQTAIQTGSRETRTD